MVVLKVLPGAHPPRQVRRSAVPLRPEPAVRRPPPSPPTATRRPPSNLYPAIAGDRLTPRKRPRAGGPDRARVAQQHGASGGGRVAGVALTGTT